MATVAVGIDPGGERSTDRPAEHAHELYRLGIAAPRWSGGRRSVAAAFGASSGPDTARAAPRYRNFARAASG